MMKNLSGVLQREANIEQKYRNVEMKKYKNLVVCLQDIQKTKNNLQVKEINTNDIIPCRKKNDKKICFENYDENRFASKELISVYKTHNVPYKECIVILERLDTNEMQQASEGISQENVNMTRTNQILELSNENCLQPILKKPVYERTTDGNSKKNSDQYEFNESDTIYETGTNQQNLQKDKFNIKHLSKVKKKKNKPNKRVAKKTKVCFTYDQTVKEIIERIMKKVNKDKIHPQSSIQNQKESFGCKEKVNNNKQHMQTSTPNRQEILFEFNVDSPIQEDNLSDVGDCNNGEYDLSDDQVNENNIKYKENETQNSNSLFSSVYSPVKRNDKVHIISDIILDETEDSFFLNQHLQPGANSAVLFSPRCRPWRFNENLRRNPHYLSIKKSALPSLQQDMIIDYIQLKKLEEHFAKIPKQNEKSPNHSTPKRSPKCFQDSVNKENIPRLSLFEDNLIDVQPKLTLDNFIKTKENRKILGPITLNTNNIVQNLNMPKSNTVETEISNKETVASTNNELNLNVHTYPENVAIKPPNNDPEPRLFEDEENFCLNESSKIYVPNTRKRNLHHNVRESNHEKHKREMTKAEEAELENWATKFNAMCEDIEKYELDIE